MNQVKLSLDAKVDLIERYFLIFNKSKALEEERENLEKNYKELNDKINYEQKNIDKINDFNRTNYHQMLFKIKNYEENCIKNYQKISNVENIILSLEVSENSGNYFEKVLRIFEEKEAEDDWYLYNEKKINKFI